MTTAASIWAVAALGLAAGGGMFFATFISTPFLLILAGLKPLEEAYRARMQSCVFHMRSEPGAIPFYELKKALRVRGGQVRRVGVTPAPMALSTSRSVSPACRKPTYARAPAV